MKRILYDYEMTSGQCINFNKFALFFSSNVPSACQDFLGGLLEVPVVDDLGYYLGLPPLYFLAEVC